ncbi:hypothetical protein SLEP1_g40139 [Rubroshorea leprosula]|uniref:Uncharacterized protein n=1 Tax=Rubroshorea leprosula TaxID=152421 RepID=A0AAV5L2R8_9ROSI|nr:hypothetical protein SLEP1_g40139 [Rubroshorea leprosula]
MFIMGLGLKRCCKSVLAIPQPTFIRYQPKLLQVNKHFRHQFLHQKRLFSIAMAGEMHIRYPKWPSRKSLSHGTAVRYLKLMQEMRMLLPATRQLKTMVG